MNAKLVKLLLEAQEREYSLSAYARHELGLDHKTAIKLERRLQNLPEFITTPCPFQNHFNHCIRNNCMNFSDGICPRVYENHDHHEKGGEADEV